MYPVLGQVAIQQDQTLLLSESGREAPGKGSLWLLPGDWAVAPSPWPLVPLSLLWSLPSFVDPQVGWFCATAKAPEDAAKAGQSGAPAPQTI